MSGFPERIKAEINKTVNHIQRLEKDQPEGWTTDKEKCVNDLVKTIEKSREDLVSDTETLLHLLADERTIAEACPEEVVHAILTSKPELILMAKGRETIPLKEFIKRGFKRMPKIIIQFMTTDVKKHSLFELGCKAAQADEVEIHTETYEEIQKAAQETGREVIQAAFDFYVPKDLLPLDVDLLEKLVRLSNPDMLRKGTGSSLSPLQQILRYDLCVENPEKQLALVKCILDKNEEGINDRVEATTQVKLGPRIVQGWKSQHSVYQWHAATRKLWHDHQNKQATVNSDGNKRAVSTVNGVPQSLRKIRGADLENGMQTKPTPGGKEGKMQAPISQSTSTMGSSPHSTLNSGKPGMSRVHAENNAARANLTEYPYSEGGMGKEGLNSPSSRPDRQNQLSTNSRTGAKQRNVEEANRASEALLQELGLRFLRWTLLEPCDAEIDSAIQKFFGDDKYRYYFVMDMSKVYLDMTEPHVKNYLKNRHYYHVLRHVVLPRARILLDSAGPKSSTTKRFTDQLQFFRWLREAGVKKILKVVVDDLVEPSHRDEEIEDVLTQLVHNGSPTPFDVEILDWRKEDLCPGVIQKVAPHLRQLHLYWSGRNSVLRGWSEPKGLPLLESLKTVYLHYKPRTEDTRRIQANVDAFKKRLGEERVKQMQQQPTWMPPALARRTTGFSSEEDTAPVELLPRIVVQDLGRTAGIGAPSSISMDTAVPASEQLWFKYVQDFVSMIPELDDTKYAGPQMQRVRVALIDDGVDYFSRGMHSLQQRIIEGQSFDTNPDDGPNTAFSSVSGHGTFMAKSILRICPFADVVSYRLKVNPDPTGKMPRPDLGSAVKAIRAAISDQVDIISMSWTIHRAGADDSTTQLRNLIGDDNNKMRIPILFCAASDDGNRAQVPEFPRNIGLRTFCIGAADSSGQVWPSVTGETHFIFPGVDIKDVFGEDALTGNTESTRGDTRIPDLVAKNGRTGSSVATALAAGLAALLIHCTKLGLHYTEQCQSKNKRPDETISAKAVASISTAEGMDAALKKLSNMSTRGTRYTNPGDVFKKATEGLKRFESNGGLENRLPESLGPIATLVRNLCDV